MNETTAERKRSSLAPEDLVANEAAERDDMVRAARLRFREALAAYETAGQGEKEEVAVLAAASASGRARAAFVRGYRAALEARGSAK